MNYPKLPVSLRPGEVVVYCDDPAHARGKVALIETYYKDARGWGSVGTITLAARRQAHADNEARPSLTDPLTGLPLNRKKIKTPNPKRENTGYRPTDDGHQKWDLFCDLCGLEPRWNEETATPILDTLVAADVRAVSLTALAARLR